MERSDLKPETLSLTLAGDKAILKGIRQIVIQRQAGTCLASYRQYPDCGSRRTSKGYHDLSLRTVFGCLKVKSPRLLRHCEYRPHAVKTFSPLAAPLPEHTTPELLFLETKWASLRSYGMTTQLLEDVVPVGDPLNAFTIRTHVLDTAERLERELDEEQNCFIEGASETGTNFRRRMVRSRLALMEATFSELVPSISTLGSERRSTTLPDPRNLPLSILPDSSIP